MASISEYIARFLRHSRDFSFPYAFAETEFMIGREISKRAGKPMSKRFLDKKNEYLLPWAMDFFRPEIQKYQSLGSLPPDAGYSPETAPIWIFWKQGINSAPQVVRELVANTKRHANGHPVILLDWHNYADYCSIPEGIVRRVEAGSLPIQQFSDILRTRLLMENGGMWVDSTILLTKAIPDYVFERPIFNVKGLNSDFRYSNVVVDSTCYQNYLLAAHPHSATYSFINDCLMKYWDTYDTLIEYFLMFYIAKLARDLVPEAAKEYDAIPDNNYDCEILGDYLLDGEPCTDDAVSHFFASNQTWAYKLSWKSQYPLRTSDGEPTLAAALKNALGNR